MLTRRALVWLLAFSGLGVWSTGCGTEGGSIGDGGARGADAAAADDAGGFGTGPGPGGSVDASLTPDVFGGTGGGSGSCLGLGAGCTTAGDCCGGDCTGNVCGYPVCTSDHAACTSN